MKETETHYYGYNRALKAYGWIPKIKIVVIDYANKSVGFRFMNGVTFRWNKSRSVAERYLAKYGHEYQIVSRHWSTAKPTVKWEAI